MLMWSGVVAGGLGLLAVLAVLTGLRLDREARVEAWARIAVGRRANLQARRAVEQRELLLDVREDELDVRERRLDLRESRFFEREERLTEVELELRGRQ